LVDRFFEARKMMQSMARGGVPGLPGQPGVGLGKRAKGRQAPQAKKKKGKVSGNPAKRAQQEANAVSGKSDEPANPFGIKPEFNPDDFQLPAGLDKYLP
ncbi:MAG: signal recognition particle protein, partial [Marmoricola sp.]